MCQCDVLVERYEEVIEDWYKGSQEEDLTTYLCEKHVLKGQDTGNAPPTSNKAFILFQSKKLISVMSGQKHREADLMIVPLLTVCS